MHGNLLVNGRLMEMFEKNPSGGYRTNGIAIVGEMVKEVPGGRARRPSSVIHTNRFCRDFGVSFESFFVELAPKILHTRIPKPQSHLISIVSIYGICCYLQTIGEKNEIQVLIAT